eukprot:TRINITY_DN3779_c0_g1_i2.p1 TRINITY_DN3779_c0_g1~~TRINITY_DN3779_c0_g1_i2.p1  ORF type:complete len:475 (-),score=117.04 TRINITY_DN3779_c0_g1_i2:134-1558(-)
MRGLILFLSVVLSIITCTFALKGADVILPMLEATMLPNEKAEWEPECFKHTKAVFTADSSSGHITINSSRAASLGCMDVYVVVVGKSFRLVPVMFHGDHKNTFHWKEGEWELVKHTGLHVFRVSPEIRAVWTAFKVFELHNPNAVREFVEEITGMKFARRQTDFAHINPDEIQDGDFLSLCKFNSVEAAIMAATYARSGHAALFLRDPATNVLHVIENQPEKGVFSTPFDIWFTEMKNGTYDGCTPESCTASLLPLSDKARQHFDAKKAWESFQRLNGQPYSDTAELLAGLDTIEPKYFDPTFTPEVVTTMMLLFPAAGDMYMVDAANMRLGTNFTHYRELVIGVDEMGLNLMEVLARPELDSWRYPGYTEPVLMCSSTVALIYKEAGLFAGLMGDDDPAKFNALEMTPRDLYQLDLFNKKPRGGLKSCDVDDDQPYCQFLGYWRQDLNDFSSVPIYPNVYEKCSPLGHFPEGC